MKLTEYVYYIYNYINTNRNKKLLTFMTNMGKTGIFFNVILVTKINIIYIFTKLFKFYNISCILVFINLQKKKNYSTN